MQRRLTGFLVLAALTGGVALVPPSPSSAGAIPLRYCAGEVATIVAQPGQSVVVGTPGDDVIRGSSGDDVIYGLGGDDRICGREGDDYIHGGPGRDILRGNAGRDRIEGGWRPDRVHGGGGRDSCREDNPPKGCEVEIGPPGSYGLPAATRTFAATVADFDGDGRDDVHITHHDHHNDTRDGIYYRRDGGFELELLGPVIDRHGCAAGDLDDNGLLDLYCQLGGKSGQATDKVDEMWMQAPEGTFDDHYEESGVSDPTGRGRFPVLFDADGDGDLDLLLTDAPRVDEEPSANTFWLNEWPDFVAAPEWGLDGDYGSAFAVAWGDWVSVGGNQGIPVHVFHNEGGSYELVDIEGLERIFSQDGEVGDLDGDGIEELVVASSVRMLVIEFEGETARVRHRVSVAEARDLALADLDGDGYLDVYVVVGGTGCDQGEVAENRPDRVFFGPDLDVQIRVDTARAGCGMAAEAIDADGDGVRDEVIVLNGKLYSTGPIVVVE